MTSMEGMFLRHHFRQQLVHGDHRQQEQAATNGSETERSEAWSVGGPRPETTVNVRIDFPKLDGLSSLQITLSRVTANLFCEVFEADLDEPRWFLMEFASKMAGVFGWCCWHRHLWWCEIHGTGRIFAEEIPHGPTSPLPDHPLAITSPHSDSHDRQTPSPSTERRPSLESFNLGPPGTSLRRHKQTSPDQELPDTRTWTASQDTTHHDPCTTTPPPTVTPKPYTKPLSR